MPTIRISLNPENHQKTFRKKETLVTFLEEEKEYWTEFFNERSPTTNLSHSTNAIKNNLNRQLSEAITQANSINDDYSNIDEIQNHISNMFMEKKLIFSESSFASFIHSQNDQVLSIYILGSYLFNGFQDTLYAPMETQLTEILHKTKPKY